MPVVVGVRAALHVTRHTDGLDVSRLVRDPKVELEIGPVVGQRVDDPLEGVGKDVEVEA